ncbi:unnamed protein product [Rhodiola kirilowii]
MVKSPTKSLSEAEVNRRQSHQSDQRRFQDLAKFRACFPAG